jgi:ADP-ribose pyrophosphatase YjhB (NUDIX family)
MIRCVSTPKPKQLRSTPEGIAERLSESEDLLALLGTMSKPIRVVALCVFRKDDSILVFEGFDSVSGTPFYRPLGGGVERGESTKQAIIREIREEIEAEVTDLELLGTLESIFTLEGQLGHEIVFVYQGRFADENAYLQDEFTVREDNGDVLLARWRPLSSFTDYHRLVPERLMELISQSKYAN